MRAVLMAGGEGLRMRPLTTTLPKPLLPVVGRPLMEHTINLLARQGITDLVITVQYQASLIRDYFADGSDFGVEIRYTTETQPLGTAGSVKAAEQVLRDEPFLVLSGDALAEVNLNAFIDSHRDHDNAMSMMLAPRADPREFGVTVLDGDDNVERLFEKPSWVEVLSDRVNTGIYCVNPEVLDDIPSDSPSDWARDIIPKLMGESRTIHGFVTDGYWEDVGSLPAYLNAQRDVLARRAGTAPDGFQISPGIWVAEGAEVDPEAELVSPVYIGPFCHVEAGARLGPDTVIGSNSVIRRATRIERCVVLDGSRVDVGAELRGAIVGRSCEIERGCRIDEGAVIAEDCTIGEESVIAGDVHIFPGKTIDAGTLVQESVVWESKTRKHLFGPRGVSGLVNVELTTEKAVRLASAFAATLPKASVVTVGRDHSRAARAFNRAVIGALTASGMTVRDLRTAAVPIVRADTAFNSAGGIVLRTTPGKPDSLDLLVLDAKGTDIDAAWRRTVERTYGRNEFRRPFPKDIGDVVVPHRVAEDYANDLVIAVDTGGVADAGLRVVVDTGGGAAALILPTLISRLGVEVLTVNNRLDENRPTETATDRAAALAQVAALVASSHADFGIRFDPAGERLSLIDDVGHVVPDDRAALIMVDLICAERHGNVALPITTTRVAELVTRYHRSEVIWTAADEAHLSARVVESGAVLGADGCGGFVVPSVGSMLDPFAVFALLSGLVARTRLTLSAIDARIPQSFVLSVEIVTPWARKAQVMRLVRERAQSLTVQDEFIGGLRVVAGPRQWVFVQADPTEAITRLWAEGESETEAEALLTQWAGVIQDAVS
jgi:mannose-1-phosphate guanylyltransferase / phosphomannomutase